MKRNWYAAIILAALAAVLWLAGWYVAAATDITLQELQQAYACSLTQDYDAAQTAYREVIHRSEDRSRILALLVRRNLLDQVNQTLRTLPSYAEPDNQADLSVETERVCEQLRQLKASFFCCF